MGETRKPSYWAIIPACVRYDAELTPNAKLLYAEISSLCDEKGYCYASNGYFAKNFELTDTSIRRLLKTLSDHGYISVDVIRDKNNEVIERRIYAGINPVGHLAPPSAQNCAEDSRQNCADPSAQKSAVYQYNYSNNTPLPPKGGKRGRKRRPPREAPDWKPDRFRGFWNFYPKKGRKNKQDAMDAWDKLQPADDLIATIGRALIKLKGTDDWKRGIGIPYVSTFLNGSRWQDADELDTPDDTPSGGSGWADDEEVL